MRSISKAIRNRKRNSWFECSESQLEIAIEEYRKETDKYAFEAENKENLELLKLSNSLKCTCKEKQELDECLKQEQKLMSKSDM